MPAPPHLTAAAGAGDRDDAGSWLSPAVASISAASFFSDAGHEIATSLLPGFLSSVLHSGPGALGIIEGSSDALVGLAKLVGGPLSNDPGRRGRLASGGYLGTAVATGAIGLATAVWQVAILRAAGWASRGLRSPARDMLLTSLTPPAAYGRAFGLERAGDNAGAVAGPLLAAGLVAWAGIRPALLILRGTGLLRTAAGRAAAAAWPSCCAVPRRRPARAAADEADRSPGSMQSPAPGPVVPHRLAGRWLTAHDEPGANPGDVGIERLALRPGGDRNPDRVD